MALDDADNIRRFILQIKGQSNQSDLNTLTSPPTSQHDRPADEQGLTIATVGSKLTDKFDKSDGATTPPHATISGQDNHHLTSPEAHPKPSPHFSGLRAPFNTPKTAASSPRLAAANTHNEDVADAFSQYVNTVSSRPLSESMWAPGSARYRTSTLSGARSANALTPIKAVEHNPAINDTFDRMSFKAADPNHKIGENLIGDRVTRSATSEPPDSFANHLSVLTDKTHEEEVDDAVQGKLEKASDESLAIQARTETVEKVQKVHFKSDRLSKKDPTATLSTEGVGKENAALSTPKADLPPHLRATRISSRTPITTETKMPRFEGLGSDVTAKIANTGSIQDAVRATTNGDEPKVTTGPGTTEPQPGRSSEIEDLEHKAIFDAWPVSEERSRPSEFSKTPSRIPLGMAADPKTAAKVRKVIIKDLPRDSTTSFVASLVYGGALEEIYIRSSAAGNFSAVVRFLDAEDCKKFYEETANGLVYKKDAKGRELVLFVELSKDVDVVGGLLQGWIASGVTRCVRAVGVEAKWDMKGLLMIAERKNRKVEKILDGQNAGGVSIHSSLLYVNAKATVAGAISGIPFL